MSTLIEASKTQLINELNKSSLKNLKKIIEIIFPGTTNRNHIFNPMHENFIPTHYKKPITKELIIKTLNLCGADNNIDTLNKQAQNSNVLFVSEHWKRYSQIFENCIILGNKKSYCKPAQKLKNIGGRGKGGIAFIVDEDLPCTCIF